ncbi:MAG: sensor histidine kinase, partial [Actinomycetota bacterium]
MLALPSQADEAMNEADFQIFESVGALVVVLDVDRRVVFWNRACSDLTGYGLEEVRGRRLPDFLLVRDEVEPVQAPTRFANHWVTKSGERRWIAWSNTSSKGADGQVQYFIKTGIDRTEPKQVEEALRNSEAKLGGIIDIAADAIISIDDDHRIVLYNHGAEKIFGWSAAEIMGRPIEILLPERFRGDHGQHVRSFGSDVMGRRMGQHMPAIFGLRKNGEEFPAQAAISKLEVDGSRLFTCALRDITEQVQRDQERELLARLGPVLLAAAVNHDETLTSIGRMVVEGLADCCIIDLTDRDGKLQRTKVLHRDPSKTALCERLERIYLDRERACLVSSVVELKIPFLMAEVSSSYLESIARDPEELQALQALTPRSLLAVPLLARGEVLGALVLVSSHCCRYGQQHVRLAEEVASRAALAIENVRLYEGARRAMYDLLEANAQLVHANIREQELRQDAEAAKARTEQSERELRQVAEFRELFIGIVGHDLRNPLSSIGMAAALLRKHGHLDERDDLAVTRIINGGQRMSRMISQLLDLTRARLGGGFPLEPKPTDLRDVCRIVLDEFETPIQIEVDGDVTGTWDPDRLAELVSNIAGNAVEHAAPGTGLLLRAHPEGTDVVVEISNQGNPIPPDLLPFIFEPFRRAKQHEKSPSGHLGLGLYIAKQIVLSHGGTIDARSADGTTTFAMRLPRRSPAERGEGP